MRISASCDYACRTILELAMHWPSKDPVQLQEISQNQEMPFKYLGQITMQLKKIGLVRSVRGKYGGYTLAKPPSSISLGKLIRQINGPLLPVADSRTKRNPVFKAIWEEVEEAMARILDKVTFEDILNKARGKEKIIVYQI